MKCLIAFGQTTVTKPLMAEDVFKNVQVLKGIPANEFMETMGFFAASLRYNGTSLAEQYGVPLDDPNEVEISDQHRTGPTAEQILDKYIQERRRK